MFELEANGNVRIDAYDDRAFDQSLLRSTPPMTMTGRGTTLVRDDLAMKPVPPAASAAAH